VGNLIWILLEIYCCLQQWKNFANRSITDKVIAMVTVAPFFDSRCRYVVLRCGLIIQIIHIQYTHIQRRNQQVNCRHIKLTYLLTAPEPALGERLQAEHSNMLSRGWHVNTRAQPEWWHFSWGTTHLNVPWASVLHLFCRYDQLRASTKSWWIIYLPYVYVLPKIPYV